jgi:molecular chaperone GrpE
LRIGPADNSDLSVSTPTDQHDAQSDQAAGAAPGAEPTSGHAPSDGAPRTEPNPPVDVNPEAARLKEQLLRMAADYDNFRKRARRDVEEAERRVQESMVRTLLPAFDNLERALVHADSAQDVRSLVDGLKMVQRQLDDTLTGLGIERVASVGVAFDPGLHEAVQQVEHSSVPAGSIAVELQAGYTWKGRLVRPAMVVVSKGPGPGASN